MRQVSARAVRFPRPLSLNRKTRAEKRLAKMSSSMTMTIILISIGISGEMSESALYSCLEFPRGFHQGMSPSRRFRPGLIASVAVAVLLPLFLYLGYWQLQRAEEKLSMQAEYDTRANGPAVQVEPRVQRPDELQFYRVVAKGHYDTDYQILIDNRVHQGRVGYHVITPLKLQDSEVRLDRARREPRSPAGVRDAHGLAADHRRGHRAVGKIFHAGPAGTGLAARVAEHGHGAL